MIAVKAVVSKNCFILIHLFSLAAKILKKTYYTLVVKVKVSKKEIDKDTFVLFFIKSCESTEKKIIFARCKL